MPYKFRDDEENQAVKQALDKLNISDPEVRSYIRQIMVTAGKLKKDDAGSLELKMITNSIKEMRYAFRVFSSYENREKISVFGSSRIDEDHEAYQKARTFSRLAANSDYMLISGGGPGIMEAVNRGAGKENSFGLHINLPFEALPNRYIRGDEKCIHFRYFFTRKLIFAKETNAVVIFPGGMGTHDELFELLTLLQTGRQEMIPMIFFDHGDYWERLEEYLSETLADSGTISETDFCLYDRVEEPEEALKVIQRFYSNFHSSRYVGDEFVMRFRHPPSEQERNRLDEEFESICPESGFRIQKGPLEGEGSEAPDSMYRLIFSFTSHDYGVLRNLVKFMNKWGPDQTRNDG